MKTHQYLLCRGGGAALVLALAAGCAVGPDYSRPPVAVPDTFQKRSSEETGSSADLGWWDLIANDPTLKGLVVEALDRNLDLRIAVSRMDETRALANINHLWPNLDASANAGRARGLVAGQGDQTLIGNQYAVGLSASWEADLWGRIRRSRESDLAQYLASEQGRRAVYLNLIGDIVGGYYNLQALDLKLAAARRTLESRKVSLAIAESQRLGGIGDKLGSSQSEASVAQAQAVLPQFEQAVHEQENRLCLLLGRPPGDIPRGTALLLEPPRELEPGLPSALLERRPDVRQSEALLRAANAQVGVATANLFPRLTLTGSLGFQSQALRDLTHDGQQAWSIGGGLLAPIFHGGELRRQKEAAVARWEQAKASYEKTVLGAFGDVSNALWAVSTSRDVVQAQTATVAAFEETLKLALLRFQAGLSPYLEVLTAQQQLFSAELGLADALNGRHRAMIQLYLALGGGWSQGERPDEKAGPS